MADISEIIPAKGSRSIIVGQSGSGKTTLARCLIPAWAEQNRNDPIIIIDTKGDFSPPHIPSRGPVVYAESVPFKGCYVVYRPGLKTDLLRELEAIFVSAYNRGNTFIYIDELYGNSVGGDYPESLLPLYSRGRSRGITIVSGVQRPSAIPLLAVTETNYQYIYRITLKEDQQRLRSVVGPHDFNVGDYEFIFNEMVQNREPKRYRLELDSFT